MEITTPSIFLQPNAMKKGQQRIIAFFKMVVLPSILIAFLLDKIFLMRGIPFLQALGAIALGLCVAFFIYIKMKKSPLPLVLNLKRTQLEIVKNEQIIRKVDYSALTLTMLYWGFESNDLQPAIQLKGLLSSKVIIGFSGELPPVSAALNASIVEYPDYLVDSLEAWNFLLSKINENTATTTLPQQTSLSSVLEVA